MKILGRVWGVVLSKDKLRCPSYVDTNYPQLQTVISLESIPHRQKEAHRLERCEDARD